MANKIMKNRANYGRKMTKIVKNGETMKKGYKNGKREKLRKITKKGTKWNETNGYILKHKIKNE